MNIDAKDIRLHLVRMREWKGMPKKGNRSTYRYKGPGISVLVDYVVTAICTPDDESCEVTSYDAEIVIKTVSGKQTLRTHGICGS
jgi:hypothetical protein